MPWRELRYVIYAERFGWTPGQVNELPLAVEPWVLPISDALNAERERRAEKAREDAQKKGLGQG